MSSGTGVVGITGADEMPADVLHLLSASVTLLFENGQTTERVISAVTRLGAALGYGAIVLPRWGEVHIHIDGFADRGWEIIAATPAGVDMHKVIATMGVIDDVCAGRIDAVAARSSLDAITRFPPVGVARFALFAAAGASALAVIFGAAHWFSLILIALSAGIGAYLRRRLGGLSRNLFVQPFGAALLAGIVGAAAVQLQLSTTLRLVAVCPCMVLVPGPHLLNGALDLIRGRLPLGASRIGYAGLIVLMICTGLLAGLALGGVNLPASAPSSRVPLGYDVVAAGVAVAAYCTFFSMPWRLLPLPIAVGMLAHAARWALISILSANAATAAFFACLLVGLIVAPIVDRLRLPFAAVGFSAVVSMMPGFFLFRAARTLLELVAIGPSASAELVPAVVANGVTAFLIILAMTVGLILPRMLFERFAAARPAS